MFCGWFVPGCFVWGLVMFLVSGWNIGFYHVFVVARCWVLRGRWLFCGFGFSVVAWILLVFAGGFWVCVLRTL